MLLNGQTTIKITTQPVFSILSLGKNIQKQHFIRYVLLASCLGSKYIVAGTMMPWS